jgi:hypothetical protein
MSPQTLADEGRVEAPLSPPTRQRNQYPLHVGGWSVGRVGERRVTTIGILVNAHWPQPKSEGAGNSRMAGLVMGREVELARLPLGQVPPPPIAVMRTLRVHPLAC